MTSRTALSPLAAPAPPVIGAARTILSIILIIIATAVQVELCRAQMRGLVPEGVEVLSRGPVHEAFASLQVFDAQPGPIITRAAPLLIDEVPPSQRPVGVNLAWIPGYWAWDDERVDFIWLSGTWRALPPGREWTAGYWARVPSGYQWTSGYWADSANRQVTYLPQPPPSLEAGPYVPAPSVDFLWSPGCWIWFQTRYAWQPGYWALGRPDWDWIPAHYVWTPRGHVFVAGYWDHPLDQRGLLFAPVWFNPVSVGSGRFRYSPRVAVDLNRFVDHLFLRPAFQHYYFGDYYASSYSAGGYVSSFTFTGDRHGHDPIHSHQVWEHRWQPTWRTRMEADFQDRRDHPSSRPGRTWPPVETSRADAPPLHEPVEGLARPYDQLQRRDNSLFRYQAVSSPERALLKTRAQEVERSTELRQLRESDSQKSQERPASVATPQMHIPRSPIRSLPSRQLPGNQSPPKSQRAPRTANDPGVGDIPRHRQ